MNSYADYARGYSYTFTDADTRSVANIKSNEWGFALYNSKAVNKEKEALNSDFVKEVTAEHKQLADDLQKAYRQSDFADQIDGFYDRARGRDTDVFDFPGKTRIRGRREDLDGAGAHEVGGRKSGGERLSSSDPAQIRRDRRLLPALRQRRAVWDE